MGAERFGNGGAHAFFKKNMRKRTQSRQYALQILYQIDLNPSEIDGILEDFWKAQKMAPDPEIRQYAERLVRGAAEHLEEIDRAIERYAENWKIDRMAYVDRNILRLSAVELCHLFDEIPAKVAINEAVDLAKRFGEPGSSKFVNGILDKIAKNECSKK